MSVEFNRNIPNFIRNSHDVNARVEKLKDLKLNVFQIDLLIHALEAYESGDGLTEAWRTDTLDYLRKENK